MTFSLSEQMAKLILAIKLDVNSVRSKADAGALNFTNLQTAYVATDKRLTDHIGFGGTSHPNATVTLSGFMSNSDKVKLDGVAIGATLNSTDAALRDRSSHTGQQLSTSISDFDSRVSASPLTGLATVPAAALSLTDTIIAAFSKVQASLNSGVLALTGHTSDANNPHSTTKSQLGLGNVDNTSDINKPVSTSQQAKFDTKQNSLGFSPVQQGGGVGQFSNKLFLGWDTQSLRLTVDNVDLGKLVLGATFLGSSTDMNTVVTSGFYRVPSGAVNTPPGTDFGQMLVCRSSDTITQILGDYSSGNLYTRSGSPSEVGGTGVYTPWRKLYAQNNAVGAVSQVSGTPAGAIIERGTNANGEYTRWADGTQICYHNLATPDAATFYLWTFPAAFVGVRVYGTKDAIPSAGSYVCSINISLTSTQFFVGVGGNSANLMAVGRWY